MKFNYKTNKVILSLIISTSIYSCSASTPTTAPEAVNALATPRASVDASASAGAQADTSYKSMYPSVAPSASASVAPSATYMPVPSGSSAPVAMSSSLPNDTTSTGVTTTMPIVEDEKTKDNFFENYGFNPFVETIQDKLSTFGVDVDTASYTWMRKSLQNNIMVYPDSVRVEEYINFFDYNYPQPKDKKLEVYTDLVNSRLGDKVNKILRVGIQGKNISSENRKSVNLTFVIDVSGSMKQENRLTLVKDSLKILVNELNQNDKVGIVVYGSNARILLSPTSADQKSVINSAIDSLNTEGSTNTEAGLTLGYSLAENSFNSNANNRIVLCSDGVANLGTTDPEVLLEKIKKQSESGISLSTIGFGMGNYNDVMMEKLADKGDGNYSYVDTLNEATRIFRKDLIGTLQTIAKDAKVQVDFNPLTVKSYRLLGYENRDVADKDFRNDNVDAGEIGSNHSVTALYELVLNEGVQSGKLANVQFLFKDVEQNNAVFEINKPVTFDNLVTDFDKSSDSFKLSVAVTEFAEILRGGYWGKESSYDKVISLALDLNNRMDSEKLSEFITLVQKAKSLNQ